MNQNNTLLDTGICYSYVEYISAYLDLLSHSMFFSTQYLDEETFHLQEELKQQFLNLPERLSGTEKEKEESIQTLLTIREKIEEKYRCLMAYHRELTLLLFLRQNDTAFVTEHLHEMGLNGYEIGAVDFYGLASDCTRYIFDNTTGEEKQKRAGMLLPYIPIKITRANYVQYISQSIKHIAIANNAESAHYLVSILKQLFDGRSFEGYGKHFHDLYLSLEGLKTLEDTAELFEEANLLNETLENVLDMLTKMFRMICTMSNLFVPNALDFNELTNMNAAFFDLYYSIKNILLNTTDKEMLLHTLPERLEKIQENIKAAYQKAAQSNPGTSPAFTLMQTYLAMDLQQIFGFATAKHSAYSEEVLSILGDFTTYLQEQLEKLPTAERKYRMQYFMSNVPFVMSKANFEAYIRQAFTHFKDPQLTLLIASQLTGILEENHFFPAPSDSPVIENHYEEDDEAARFIAEHSDLFKEDDTEDPFAFFETPSGDLSHDDPS